ncbi:MAG: hypothetical protein Q9211_000691, partial [Gyalolechia sp. 1 TL-2023]
AAGTQIDYWTCNSIPQSSSNPDEPEQQQQHSKEPSPPTSSYTRSSSSTVIRHLVHACYTLLLDIYIALLTALQYDAERWSSSCRPAAAVSSTAALADIALVLTVQLCSYLIKRQHQAMDLFLSSQQQQQNEGPGSSRQPSPPPASTTCAVMSDLEMEVQHRLERLRQTLRI